MLETEESSNSKLTGGLVVSAKKISMMISYQVYNPSSWLSIDSPLLTFISNNLLGGC